MPPKYTPRGWDDLPETGYAWPAPWPREIPVLVRLCDRAYCVPLEVEVLAYSLPGRCDPRATPSPRTLQSVPQGLLVLVGAMRAGRLSLAALRLIFWRGGSKAVYAFADEIFGPST